jgi:hypothetical protein
MSVTNVEMKQLGETASFDWASCPVKFHVLFKAAAQSDALSVRGLPLKADEIPVIFSFLNQHPHITAFAVNFGPIMRLLSQNLETALATALEINSTLASLDVSGCAISDEGTKALAKALRINSTLASLDMSACSISIEGARALAKALTANTSLSSLNISSNANLCCVAQQDSQALLQMFRQIKDDRKTAISAFENQKLVFLMGTHRRLGEESKILPVPGYSYDKNVFKTILSLMGPSTPAPKPFNLIHSIPSAEVKESKEENENRLVFPNPSSSSFRSNRLSQ